MTPAHTFLMLQVTMNLHRGWIDYAASISDLLLTLITLVLAIYAIKQTHVAKTAADAAKLAADAAITADRAWIMIDIKATEPPFSHHVKTDKSGKRVYSTTSNIEMIFVNHGKTPARMIDARLGLAVIRQEEDLPAVPDFSKLLYIETSFVVPAGQTEVTRPSLSYEALEQPGSAVIVYGVVRYRHMFSDRLAETTFAYTLHAKVARQIVKHRAYNQNT